MKRRNFLTSITAACASVSLASKRQKKIFVVIDDAGLTMSETERFLEIPISMTIAALPHQRCIKGVCEAVKKDRRKELILHQPMEATNPKANPGPGAIMNATDPRAVSKIISQSLKSVTGAVGMNNHMGSRVTENATLVKAVLKECKKRKLFFLDSKTAYNSMVPRVAPSLGMHVEERHIFLDIQKDQAYVRRMWGHAVAHAKQHGYVVVIGHVWSKETSATIRDSYETLLNQGYTFGKLSELYS